MPSPTQREGKRQESRAEAALVRAGYRVVARNWRGGGGEIDCIAWDRDVLVFVEVRARADVRHGRPGETVGFGKQRKLVRAALAYLTQHRGAAPAAWRFDVVEVVMGGGEVTIVRNAFDASVAFGRGAIPFV